MRFTDDERGQSIQIGAIILFGALVVALSAYQAFAIPEQNREVEFKHSQQVQNDLQELRSTIVSMASGAGSESVAVQLGTNYPTRALFVNPGPPSGTIQTVGTGNSSLNITIRNATASGDTSDYWDGKPIRYSTGAVVYEPNYNVYKNPPTTIYGNTVLYNQFRDGNLTLTDQQLVDGRTINLVAMNGSLSESRSGTVSLDVKAASSSGKRVAVSNTTSGNVTITVPTRLNKGTWQELLTEEFDENGGYVYNITTTPLSNTEFPRLLTLRFERNATYDLRVARAGLGTNVEESTTAAYLVRTAGNGSVVPEGGSVELEVEVRDDFNNPLSGETVEANTSRGDASVTSRATTDGNGVATLTYEAPDNVDGTQSDTVNVSLNTSAENLRSSVNSSTATNVTFSLTIDDSDGSGSSGTGGASYDVMWRDAALTAGDTSGAVLETCGIPCTDGVLLSAKTDPTGGGKLVTFYTNDSSAISLSPDVRVTPSNGVVETNLSYSTEVTEPVELYASNTSGEDTEWFTTGLRSRFDSGSQNNWEHFGDGSSGISSEERNGNSGGALEIRNAINGGGVVTKNAYNASTAEILLFEYWAYELNAEGGEDLAVEYLDKNGNWDTVATHQAEPDNNGEVGALFEKRVRLNTTDALHDGLKVRFRQVSATGSDEWYIDDVRLSAIGNVTESSGGQAAPTANAGGSYTVQEGQTVTLDGTGSSDPNGDSLSYSWSITGNAYGATITNPNSASPTFDASGSDVGQNRDVTVELQVSDGNGRSDTDTTTVIIEPSQAGSIQVTPNVQSAGNSGKYSFELENTGSVDATIVALGINNTTDAQATKVGGNADDPIFEETSPQSRQLISTVIQFDSNTQTAARYNFDQNVDLARGQARTFEFDRFRDSSDGNGKMKDDTVYITLWFSDGSTATIELAP